MFVHCKKARLFKHPTDGNVPPVSLPPGYVGQVPDWVTELPFFKACCESGTITALINTSDKALAQSMGPDAIGGTALLKAAADKRAADALYEQALADAGLPSGVSSEPDTTGPATGVTALPDATAVADEAPAEKIAKPKAGK